MPCLHCRLSAAVPTGCVVSESDGDLGGAVHGHRAKSPRSGTVPGHRVWTFRCGRRPHAARDRRINRSSERRSPLWRTLRQQLFVRVSSDVTICGAALSGRPLRRMMRRKRARRLVKGCRGSCASDEGITPPRGAAIVLTDSEA